MIFAHGVREAVYAERRGRRRRRIRPENRECVEEATEEILEEYRANDAFTVIEQDDIDMDAFISQAEEFFEGYFTGENLEAYQAIRETAG